MGERLTQRIEDSHDDIQLNELYTLSSSTSGGSSSQVSKFAAIIGATMPEAYPEENLRRAQCLLRGSQDEDFVFECLMLLIYTFSNNIIDPFCFEFSSQWKAALVIIRNSSIMNRTIDFKRFNSLTINGFVESLFYATLHMIKDYNVYLSEEGVEIATWLLKSGQDPNNIQLAVPGSYVHPQTPLQLAIVRNKLDLVENLLEAKADANIVPSCYGTSSLLLSPLEMAAGKSSQDFLLLLLNHGASANIDQALHLAIRRSKIDSASLLLKHGANPYAAYRTQEGPVYEDTALTVAAATGLRELEFVLEFTIHGSLNKTPSSLITADMFVAAAMMHDSATFLRRYPLPGTSVTNGHDITPLHAAIAHSKTDYFKSLLPSYDLRTLTTPIPPLWLACAVGKEDITKLIIESGADVNAEARVSEKYRKVLLLSQDIELHSTPLGCIMHSRHSDRSSYAIMLIEAGATLTGSELFVAAAEMDYDLLLAALVAGANPNASNKEGKRPLQLALEASGTFQQKSNIVECLIHHQAIVSQEEVISGICCDHFSILELLLSHGGNLLDPNREGITPLEAAIFEGKLRLLNEIFERHPEIYDPGSICAALNYEMNNTAEKLVANRPTQDPLDIIEMTALGMAVGHGNISVFKELLRYPIPSKVCFLSEWWFRDVDMCLRWKDRPFWRKSHGVLGNPLTLVVIISMLEHRDAFSGFRELLQRDFQPDIYTWYAISVKGEKAYAESLRDKGYALEARPDHPTLPHLDPLCESILFIRTDIFKIFLEVGKSFIRQHPHSIHLSYAIGYTRVNMMESLLTVGATINGHPPDGITPLQVAVNLGESEVVSRLLKAGADVNRWNQNIKYGRSPLQSAIEKVDLEMIDCLLKKGADVNAPPAPEGGATALQLAAIMGQVGLAQRLLDLGANVDAPGAKISGRTALEGAAQHGRIDMLKLLLTHGACLTGPGRRQYIRSVYLTNNYVLRRAAQKLLIAAGGWSDSDDRELQVEMQKLHEERDSKNAFSPLSNKWEYWDGEYGVATRGIVAGFVTFRDP